MPGRKKTKKANGEGSTYQRKMDGRWVGQLTLTDGRRKFFYGKSHDEVHRELTKALADQQRGLPILGSRQTVAQFLERWLTTSKRSQLRPRTYARYEALVRLHVTPQIGSVLLHKLSPQHLADLYSTLATAPPPSKRGPSRTRLSKRTVQFVHAILHGALKRAVKWRLIALNPADAVDAPRPERHEMHALTQEQARLLLHAAEGERLEALYVLALSTGMRLGELL